MRAITSIDRTIAEEIFASSSALKRFEETGGMNSTYRNVDLINVMRDPSPAIEALLKRRQDLVRVLLTVIESGVFGGMKGFAEDLAGQKNYTVNQIEELKKEIKGK
jgi:hypothetical protein